MIGNVGLTARLAAKSAGSGVRRKGAKRNEDGTSTCARVGDAYGHVARVCEHKTSYRWGRQHFEIRFVNFRFKTADDSKEHSEETEEIR